MKEEGKDEYDIKKQVHIDCLGCCLFSKQNVESIDVTIKS